MIIIEGTDKITSQNKPYVVALGNFDGVHKGHQHLLQQMREYSQRQNAFSTVMLFNPHPQQLLDPHGCPKLLIDTEKKIELIEEQGIDGVIIIPFDHTFASLSPEGFIDKILVEKLQTEGVFVGYDYRFGHMACGTPGQLKKYGNKKGLFVNVVSPNIYMGDPVSSTSIRKSLLRGDIGQAKGMLGYWPILKGKIIHGDQRGRQLGFPTANIYVSETLLIPKDGVYAGATLIKGKSYMSVINIGTKPTFGSCDQKSIEAHLLDFQGDVYSEKIEISFVKRLRDERRFEKPELLIKQIKKDVDIAVDLLENIRNDLAIYNVLA